ncbi:hypothetical protein NDU88_006029 [Pleurodeles waltl]|uniref:Uncharacterized protein n=1 Tax=Pleurodeles waltl TaxID=8319 RepID=A0AAV7TW07_PLEWA|nr:hypothetical protein NDU88_006029 [Pleurodeles waltl]
MAVPGGGEVAVFIKSFLILTMAVPTSFLFRGWGCTSLSPAPGQFTRLQAIVQQASCSVRRFSPSSICREPGRSISPTLGPPSHVHGLWRFLGLLHVLQAAMQATWAWADTIREGNLLVAMKSRKTAQMMPLRLAEHNWLQVLPDHGSTSGVILKPDRLLVVADQAPT